MSILDHEAATIRAIANRASALGAGNASAIAYDLMQVHENVCALDLERMHAGRAFDLLHDVCGIQRHLDGVLNRFNDGFSPRFAKRN